MRYFLTIILITNTNAALAISQNEFELAETTLMASESLVVCSSSQDRGQGYTPMSDSLIQLGEASDDKIPVSDISMMKWHGVVVLNGEIRFSRNNKYVDDYITFVVFTRYGAEIPAYLRQVDNGMMRFKFSSNIAFGEFIVSSDQSKCSM